MLFLFMIVAAPLAILFVALVAAHFVIKLDKIHLDKPRNKAGEPK